MLKTALQMLFVCLLAWQTTAQNIQLTFRVDLSKVQNQSLNGAFLAGNFNGWTPEAMTSVGNGVFEKTASVAANSNVQYKFYNGPTAAESAPELADCGADDGAGGFNRLFVAGSADAELPVVCFDKCEGCKVYITLRVDMAQAGTVPSVWLAVDETDGNGIGYFTQGLPTGNGSEYAAQIQVPVYSTTFFHWKNGGTPESTANLGSCSATNQFGGTSRVVSVNATDLNEPAVCFGHCGACVPTCASDTNSLICDNFNDYIIGPVGPQSDHWTVWSGNEAGPEDAYVLSVQSSDGGYSLKISGDTSSGQSFKSEVLKLGNRTTGGYDLRWKQYQATGKAAFFNINSSENVPSPVWQVVISPTGHGFLQNNYGQIAAEFDVETDAWTDFRIVADLDKKVFQLEAAGVSVANFAYAGSLGAVNFAAVAEQVEYFVDEIEFRKNASATLGLEDDCESAFDLTAYFQAGGLQTTGLFDNTTATVSPQDSLAFGYDCFLETLDGEQQLDNTLWFSFIGTGKTYEIQSVPCNAGVNYLQDGDTQMALFDGSDCAALTPLDCNDDLGFAVAGDFRAALTVPTVSGQNYHLMVDGYGGAAGQFCLQIEEVYRATLLVDASKITVDATGLFIQGSWDGWAAPIPMTDLGGGLWQYIANASPNDTIFWKYQNGPGNWEPSADLAACGTDDGFGGFNRQLIVSKDTTLALVCFASCAACEPENIDDCDGAADLTPYLGAGPGVSVTAGSFSNLDATVAATDPTTGFECFAEQTPSLEHTVWFKFVGDGKMYSFHTVDCGLGTDYLQDGDAQLAVYEGGTCGAYGPAVACNDDTDVNNGDFSSTVVVQTIAGENYWMLMDGWNGSQGAFCLEIMEITPVSCAQGSLGAPEADVINLCYDQITTFLLDENGTVIPNIGPYSGFTWVVTSAPISGLTTNPGLDTSFFGNYGITSFYYEISYQNPSFLNVGTYYFTPVAFANAVPAEAGQQVGQLNSLADGCWLVGQSIQLNVLEELPFLDAAPAVTPATTPPGNNGAIQLTVTGGSGAYVFAWSNGATTQNLSNLAAGTYTVTISDEGGCVDLLIYPIVVPSGVATDEIEGLKTLAVQPNPTSGHLFFDLVLSENKPVRFDLMNALGQILETTVFENGQNLHESLNLSSRADGIYSLRFTVESRTAVRRVVLTK